MVLNILLAIVGLIVGLGLDLLLQSHVMIKQ